MGAILYTKKINSSTTLDLHRGNAGGVLATVSTGWRAYNGVFMKHTGRFSWDTVPSSKVAVETANNKAQQFVQ